MLLMTFSMAVTHRLASSPLVAMRSRFFLRSLKKMEKHRSSMVVSVCLLRPSDWRPRRTDAISSMETGERAKGKKNEKNEKQLQARGRELQHRPRVIWI